MDHIGSSCEAPFFRFLIAIYAVAPVELEVRVAL